MKQSFKFFKLPALLIVAVMLMVACSPAVTPPPVVVEPPPVITVSMEDLAGSYEGEWAMSPMMKPLASLVMKEDNTYEFYLSIMGLMEEGTFEIQNDYVVAFTSAAGGEPIKGKYDEGFLTVAFPINNSPTEISYMQVGSPEDVYQGFLGDYRTTVMGRLHLLIGLRKGQQYIDYYSKQTGTFKVSGGKITLTPSDNSIAPMTGPISLSTKDFTVSMELMGPGRPSELTFTKIAPEDVAVYKGRSTVGMAGFTDVTLLLKPGNAFEILTASPRGVGYFVVEEDGKIVLTYMDPPTTPDGEEYIMTGTTANQDVFATGNKISIESVKYTLSMGDGPRIMDLLDVEFTLEP